MINRRRFLINSAASMGASVLGGSHLAQAAGNNPFCVEGYNYCRPNFKKRSRILFQGDSITDMNRGRDERDRNHYLGHSYVYLIAARLGADMPETALDFYNRGISGHKVADLRNRWQTDTIDMKPDLLSILIGINDVEAGVSPESFEKDYRYILDTSRKANPDLRLVLLEPFILQSGRLQDQQVWKSRRAATDKLRTVVAQLADQYDVVFIKTQNIFDSAADAVSPEYWMWDGIHPLPQGHELIARQWLQEVSTRWPNK